MATAMHDDMHANDEQRLLLSMIEELKLPLLHAQQQIDVHSQTSDSQLDAVRQHIARGLWLIDAYALNLEVHARQVELVPVSVSSVLYDAAQQLSPLAEQYSCSIEMSIEGRYLPVMADRRVLETALVGIGSTLIRASKQPDHTLTLAVHKHRDTVVAGVFSDQIGLTDKMLAQGRALYGKARQPISQLTASPAAGLFIADNLLEALQSSLRAAQHRNQKGLAVALTPSAQLALV